MKELNEDERLAAFLDGRLDEREREAMLARLTADDDAYEVFAHTAQVLRLAEADAAAAGAPEDEGVIPLHGRAPVLAASRRPAVLRWLALAAVLAGVALAGRALWPRSSAGADPVRVAARLEHVSAGLPLGFIEDTPWASVRGDGAPGGASPEERVARAAHAGALLLDLSVAVQGRDAAKTRLLAAQVIARTGSGGALRTIADGAGSPPERLQPLVEEATERIAKRLGQPEALRLGIWVEAARLAAATHDAAFFADARTQGILDDAARLEPSARAAVEQVRGLLPGAGSPRWDALAAALD
ncbi:MAG TPA: hypothetical protein VM890_04075, partial [Longimicrobium sp.]|nr:hypothetical protein [Longimicrobium sp.]